MPLDLCVCTAITQFDAEKFTQRQGKTYRFVWKLYLKSWKLNLALQF